MKFKVAYLTTVPAPHQIKLVEELNKHCDARFFFLDNVNRNRPSWWNIKLNKYCEVVETLVFRFKGKYFLKCIPDSLINYDPDVVMVGGFSNPASYQIYRWARNNNKKTAVFTELSRDKNGALREYGYIWRLLSHLYRNVDSIFACHPSAVHQFKIDLKFGKKVKLLRYASDIDSHLKHPIRRPSKNLTLFFPNRLVEIYNPLGALIVFKILKEKYPDIKLKINAQGNLKPQCDEFININNLTDSVTFLTEINSWDDLPNVYESCDILVFPAKFSNGNFTINECMASGLGIVISNHVNGHGDFLKNNVNCFISSDDPKEFAFSVEKYILEPELLKVHGIKNKEAVRHLSIESVAIEYANEFSKTIKKK